GGGALEHARHRARQHDRAGAVALTCRFRARRHGHGDGGVCSGLRRSGTGPGDHTTFRPDAGAFRHSVDDVGLRRDRRGARAGGGEVVTVVASYRMHPYRPRFRLTKLREIWSFSAWMQFAAVGGFFAEQTDQIVVGGLAGAAQMGGYHVASDAAMSPTNELVVP